MHCMKKVRVVFSISQLATSRKCDKIRVVLHLIAREEPFEAFFVPAYA